MSGAEQEKELKELITQQAQELGLDAERIRNLLALHINLYLGCHMYVDTDEAAHLLYQNVVASLPELRAVAPITSKYPWTKEHK